MLFNFSSGPDVVELQSFQGMYFHTSHFTLHISHYTLHTSHFTFHTSHYTFHTSHFTFHTSHFTLHISHFTLHTWVMTGSSSCVFFFFFFFFFRVIFLGKKRENCILRMDLGRGYVIIFHNSQKKTFFIHQMKGLWYLNPVNPKLIMQLSQQKKQFMQNV